MNKVKSALAILAFISAAACASAKNIGIQVIQKESVTDAGLESTALQTVRSSTYLIEDTMLNSFFDNGYIVTNSPVAITSGTDSDKIERKALQDAFEGQTEILVILQIDYNSDSTNPQANLLENINSISMKIVNPFNQTTITQKTYTVGAVNASTNSSDGIKKFTVNIAKDIFSALKSVR